MISSLLLLFWVSVPVIEDSFDFKGWAVFGLILTFNWLIWNCGIFYNNECASVAQFLP